MSGAAAAKYRHEAFRTIGRINVLLEQQWEGRFTIVLQILRGQGWRATLCHKDGGLLRDLSPRLDMKRFQQWLDGFEEGLLLAERAQREE